jgi:hypothetical protein
MILDIGLVAGRPDKVRDLARRALERHEAGRLTNSGPWDIPILKFYAGEDESALREFAGPFHFERVTISHSLGLWQFAHAESTEELNEAKALLRGATRCAYPGWWTPLFSSAYLQLIEEGRLLPPKFAARSHATR